MALAAIAGVLTLPAAGAMLAVAVAAGAAPLGALDDTTVPVTTEPAPDPAPAPAPKPKPAPKPTPKPAPKKIASTPARSYTAPTSTYSAPTYTPPRSTTTKRAKRHVARKHKKVRKPAPVTTSVPELTTPNPAAIVPVAVGARRAISRTRGDAAVTSILFIGGVGFAALLFLLAAAVPGTRARFTPVGRVVIDHQQDLVLVGLAAFVITIFVYVLTGHGP
jgi:outer membrane biosynthesis protein TonB